ncbi:MAG: radical SAM protein, partial [Flavobacteriales bacterium]|nr:radical SAM protein [Flavobacteriales bacterium]
LQSAFWHRFAMTAHSPVGLEPSTFKVKNLTPETGTFANNDLTHADPTGADHDLFKEGLTKSLFNFMHATALDEPLQTWFGHRVPKTSLPPDLIEGFLVDEEFRETKPNHVLVWTGGPVHYDAKLKAIIITGQQDDLEIPCPAKEGVWLTDVLLKMTPWQSTAFTYAQLQESYADRGLRNFPQLWFGNMMEAIREEGLLVV